MAKHRKSSNRRIAKAVGVGLFAGGLLLGAPAALASADTLSDAVSSVNDAVQGVVETNNDGLQGVTAINNDGLQSNTTLNNAGLNNGVDSLQAAAAAGNTTTQTTVTKLNTFVKFSVFGLLKGSG